jgi:YVTN family beta-propeller protein
MPLVRESALVAVLTLLGSGCHSSPTAPEVVLTHPSGVQAARVTGFVGRPFAVRVSSQNVVYVTEQDANAVAPFDLATLVTPLPIAAGADPGDVVFNRTGRTALVSGYNDGLVQVIDVASGQRARVLPVAQNAYRLALSRDETRVFVTSTDGRLYAVPVDGSAPTSFVSLGSALSGLALTPTSETLIVSSTDGTIWKVNAATLQIIGSAATGGGRLQDVAIAPDESEIYAASEDGWVDVFDAATLQRKRRVTLPGLSPFGLALTPDGAQLYVTSAVTGDLAIIDRTAGTVVRTIKLTGTPRRVAFDQSGSTAVIANEGNWVDLVR